jgi:hypothetical protein
MKAVVAYESISSAEGELERARAWGQSLAERLSPRKA